MTAAKPRDLAAEFDALAAQHASLLQRVARLEVINRLVTQDTLDALPDHEAEAVTGEPTDVRRARIVDQERTP